MLISANLLKPAVIKQRNRANAISMVGQFARWVMDIWYAIVIGYIASIYNLDLIRELPPMLKNLEFVLIPIVEVYTSAPIQRFMDKS